MPKIHPRIWGFVVVAFQAIILMIWLHRSFSSLFSWALTYKPWHHGEKNSEVSFLKCSILYSTTTGCIYFLVQSAAIFQFYSTLIMHLISVLPTNSIRALLLMPRIRPLVFLLEMKWDLSVSNFTSSEGSAISSTAHLHLFFSLAYTSQNSL